MNLNEMYPSISEGPELKITVEPIFNLGLVSVDQMDKKKILGPWLSFTTTQISDATGPQLYAM